MQRSRVTNRAESPLLAALLLVAFTIATSSAIGVHLLSGATDYTESANGPGGDVVVSHGDQGTSVLASKIPAGNTLSVYRGQEFIGNFTEGDTGERFRFPTANGESVTVIATTDRGSKRVIHSSNARESTIISLYKYEETSGPAVDEFGRYPGNVSTEVIRNESGVNGSGFQFPKNSKSVVSSNTSVIPNNTRFTVSVWINSDNPNGTVIDRTTDLPFRVAFDSNKLVWRYSDADGDTVNASYKLPNALSEGGWHHIAVLGTYDPMNGDGRHELYLDGERVATASPTGTWKGEPTMNKMQLGYPTRSSGGGKVAKTEFVGWIDEVYIIRGGSSDLVETLCQRDAPSGHQCAS